MKIVQLNDYSVIINYRIFIDLAHPQNDEVQKGYPHPRRGETYCIR